MSPNEICVGARIAVIPMMANGTVSIITIGGPIALNNATMIMIMITVDGTIPGISARMERSVLSYSPSQKNS